MYSTGSKRPWDAEEVAPPETSDEEETGTNSSAVSSENQILEKGENDSDGSVDTDQRMTDVREVLQNTLDGVSSALDQDCVECHGTKNPINPGLTLKSSGIVGLPLSNSDAVRIAREATVGGKDIAATETLGYDCDLGPDKFELRNPAWHQSVMNLGAAVLGKSAYEVRAELITLSLHASTTDNRRPHLYVDWNLLIER